MGNIKKYIHFGIFFVFCRKIFDQIYLDSQYIDDNENSKTKKLSLTEILELTNLLISLQNNKNFNNERDSTLESLYKINNQSITTELNITENFNNDSIKSSKFNNYSERKLERKINCNLIIFPI